MIGLSWTLRKMMQIYNAVTALLSGKNYLFGSVVYLTGGAALKPSFTTPPVLEISREDSRSKHPGGKNS